MFTFIGVDMIALARGGRMLKAICLVVSAMLSLSTVAMADQYDTICQNGREVRPNGQCVRDATGQCVPCPVATPVGGDSTMAYIIAGGVVIGTAVLIFTQDNGTTGPVSP